MECRNCVEQAASECDKCSELFCGEECFESHPCARIGKSFQSWLVTSVPEKKREGALSGITAFERLGVEIGHFKIQTRLRKRSPFQETPIRELLVNLHSQYYLAATYWAQWALGVDSDALALARLMEDTVRTVLSTEANTLRYLENERIDNVYRELYEDLEPLKPAEKIFASSEAERVLRTTVNPQRFAQKIKELDLYSQPEIDVIVSAWTEGPLEAVKTTVIIMDQVIKNRRRLLSKVLIKLLAYEFSQFGETLLSQLRGPPANVAESFWQ